MKEARLFDEKEMRVVSAFDVKNGIINRNEQFVDVEEKFRVIYVSESKGHGNPYFRLYMSREDYKKLSPEQKDKYDILRTMRHYKESPWHREWKEKLSSFCCIEKSIRNEEDCKYKIADAFYVQKKTVIELQHSFIANDFEERNNHYGKIGLNVIWLYDLPRARLKKISDNVFEILEDNAKGFFRIAEVPQNLSHWPIFIQTADKTIYLVNKIDRKQIPGNLKSTIRFIHTVAKYSEEDFLNALKNMPSAFCSSDFRTTGKSISDLWTRNYSGMIVKDILSDDIILLSADSKKLGFISGNFKTGNIQYRYVGKRNDGKGFYVKSEKYYDLSVSKALEKRWVLCDFKLKSGAEVKN